LVNNFEQPTYQIRQAIVKQLTAVYKNY